LHAPGRSFQVEIEHQAPGRAGLRIVALARQIPSLFQIPDAALYALRGLAALLANLVVSDPWLRSVGPHAEHDPREHGFRAITQILVAQGGARNAREFLIL